MRRQEFDEALGLGRATAEVIELARRVKDTITRITPAIITLANTPA
jgi:hypothetical protein